MIGLFGDMPEKNFSKRRKKERDFQAEILALLTEHKYGLVLIEITKALKINHYFAQDHLNTMRKQSLIDYNRLDMRWYILRSKES